MLEGCELVGFSPDEVDVSPMQERWTNCRRQTAYFPVDARSKEESMMKPYCALLHDGSLVW